MWRRTAYFHSTMHFTEITSPAWSEPELFLPIWTKIIIVCAFAEWSDIWLWFYKIGHAHTRVEKADSIPLPSPVPIHTLTLIMIQLTGCQIKRKSPQAYVFLPGEFEASHECGAERVVLDMVANGCLSSGCMSAASSPRPKTVSCCAVPFESCFELWCWR